MRIQNETKNIYPEIISEEELNKMIDIKLEQTNKEINKEKLVLYHSMYY